MYPTINILVPEEFSTKLDKVTIVHMDNYDELEHALSMGYNLINIDEGDSMVPKEKTFSPDSNPSHDEFLSTLCAVSETNNTQLIYTSESTHEFFCHSTEVEVQPEVITSNK